MVRLVGMIQDKLGLPYIGSESRVNMRNEGSAIVMTYSYDGA